VSALSKAWVCCRCLAGNCELESCRGHRVSFKFVVCQIDVSVTGQLYSNGSPTDCGESESDGEASKMRKPRPTRGGRVA